MSTGKSTEFSNILSRLRKERGISQKQVASDLGISQALLSHYEKGIRECGLDFVVKCSKYYGVTTDYLLGVSENRHGMGSEYFDSAEKYENSIAKATKIMLDTAVTTDKEVAQYLKDYYLLCIYRGAITLAKAGVISTDLFKFDITTGHELASAAIAILDVKFAFIEEKARTGFDSTNESDLKKVISDAEEYILNNLLI